MKLLVLLSVLVADTWVYQDAEGEDVYTDDPSSVPDELRGTLRPVGGESEDEEAGVFSTFEDRARDPEEERRREIRVAHKRELTEKREQLIDEITKLRRAYHKAANEHRKFKAGGRIGAADKAAAAGAEADRRKAELTSKETELKRVEAQLAVLD